MAAPPTADGDDNGRVDQNPKSDRDQAERRQRRTLYIAIFALAVAIGHVVYAFFRDHVSIRPCLQTWFERLSMSGGTIDCQSR